MSTETNRLSDGGAPGSAINVSVRAGRFLKVPDWRSLAHGGDHVTNGLDNGVGSIELDYVTRPFDDTVIAVCRQARKIPLEPRLQRRPKGIVPECAGHLTGLEHDEWTRRQGPALRRLFVRLRSRRHLTERPRDADRKQCIERGLHLRRRTIGCALFETREKTYRSRPSKKRDQETWYGSRSHPIQLFLKTAILVWVRGVDEHYANDLVWSTLRKNPHKEPAE